MVCFCGQHICDIHDLHLFCMNVEGVEFEEDKFDMPDRRQNVEANKIPIAGVANNAHASLGGQKTSSGMAGWLLSRGLAKSPKTANIILIAVALINVVITFLVVMFFLS